MDGSIPPNAIWRTFVDLRKLAVAAPVAAAPAAAAPAPAVVSGHQVVSPMVGTFYRAS